MRRRTLGDAGRQLARPTAAARCPAAYGLCSAERVRRAGACFRRQWALARRRPPVCRRELWRRPLELPVALRAPVAGSPVGGAPPATRERVVALGAARPDSRAPGLAPPSA